MWLLVKGDGGSPRKLINMAHIEHICITGGGEKDIYDVVAYRYPDGAGEREADWQEYDLFNGLTEEQAIAAVEGIAGFMGSVEPVLPDDNRTRVVCPKI